MVIAHYNNSPNGTNMSRADLYTEVLKYYGNDRISQLEDAIEKLNELKSITVGLDYEEYFNRRFNEIGVELTRQLSCATKKPLVYP